MSDRPRYEPPWMLGLARCSVATVLAARGTLVHPSARAYRSSPGRVAEAPPGWVPRHAEAETLERAREDAAYALEGALRLFGHRWKPTVLFWLATGPQRRRDLERHLPRHVSAKVLTEQLRGLETDGLVCRADRTPAGHGRHVTYALTPFGESLRPVIAALARWSFEQREVVHRLRRVAVGRSMTDTEG